MQNAHLRLGQLEYLRSTANVQTRIRLQVDRYMGEEADGHLLSLYGGDAEVGAIAAAIHEKHPFTLTFPDGKSKTVSMGGEASCYRGSVAVPGRNQPLRHLVAVSQALQDIQFTVDLEERVIAGDGLGRSLFLLCLLERQHRFLQECRCSHSESPLFAENRKSPEGARLLASKDRLCGRLR